jgi:hypothetical protein
MYITGRRINKQLPQPENTASYGRDKCGKSVAKVTINNLGGMALGRYHYVNIVSLNCIFR